MKALLALSFLFASLPALAGQESHGGNVLLCPGKEPVVLDYYNAMLPAPGNPNPRVEDLTGMKAQGVVVTLGRKLDGTALGEEYHRAFALIGNTDLWAVADNLSDVHDQNLEYPIPSGCTLKQAAIRQGTGILIDSQVANTISPAQLGMLVVHEILFYIATGNGQTDSSSVRNAVRALMRKDFPDEQLEAVITGLGAKHFWEQARAAQTMGTAIYRCIDGAEKCGNRNELDLDWNRSMASTVKASIISGRNPTMGTPEHTLFEGAFSFAGGEYYLMDPSGTFNPVVQLHFLAPNRIENRFDPETILTYMN